MASVWVFVCVYLTFIPQTFTIDTCSVENIMQVLDNWRTGSAFLDSFSYSLIERTLQTRPGDVRHILDVWVCSSIYTSGFVQAGSYLVNILTWWSEKPLLRGSSFTSVAVTLTEWQLWRRKCLFVLLIAGPSPSLREVRLRTQGRNQTEDLLAISHSNTRSSLHQGTWFTKKSIRNPGWFCLLACSQAHA
jgi:hypothetical protein